MTAGVKVRKRGASARTVESWEDALIEFAGSMKHGAVSVLHERGCPAMRGAVCECVGHVIGPAIREPQ